MKPLEQKALRDVAQEIRDKAILERALLTRVRAHLDRIAASFKRSYASTGMMPNLTAHRERLAILLADHYRKTGDRFADTVLAQLGVIPEGVQELRDLALVRWIDLRAPAQASAIVTTSERRMPSFVNQASRTLNEEQKPATLAAIAATAANLLRLNGRQRAPLIASFETQVPAETTKRITAEAASGRVPFPLAGGGISVPTVADPVAVTTKQWQTEQDGNVRPAHVAANRQTVPMDEPFIVGGERLNFPGDTSFGASLSNVIGCRCASIYEVGEAS